MVARVWEMQMRGVLHVHPVLACATARQKVGVRFYVGRLADLAPQYGFGFADRKAEPQPAVNAAAYLSSYFVKGAAGEGDPVGVGPVAVNAPLDRARSVKLTQETGCTMRLLRFRRFVCFHWHLTLPCWQLRIVDQRGFRVWADLVTEIKDRAPPRTTAEAPE
jgi:hypothetical protein